MQIQPVPLYVRNEEQISTTKIVARCLMITDGSSVFKSIGHDSPRYVWDCMLKYIRQLYTDFMQFMLTVYHSMTYESYLPELSRMETLATSGKIIEPY